MLSSLLVLFFFFFFKQKTAYEMRISDWSSDVCSSDLAYLVGAGEPVGDTRQRQIGSGRDAPVDANIGQQSIGMLINMVHHPEEDQRFGDRITKGRDGHALGSIPFDLQAEPSVAEIGRAHV